MKLRLFAAAAIALCWLSPASAEVACHQNDTARVAVEDKNEMAGTVIAVYPHTPVAGCFVDAASARFVFGEGDESLWFDSLTRSHLVMTRSTGPQGDLVIADLETGRIVLDAPANDFTVETEGVTFWERVAAGTSENCPQIDEYVSDGLGAAIEERRHLDFATAKVERSSERRCVAVQ